MNRWQTTDIIKLLRQWNIKSSITVRSTEGFGMFIIIMTYHRCPGILASKHSHELSDDQIITRVHHHMIKWIENQDNIKSSKFNWYHKHRASKHRIYRPFGLVFDFFLWLDFRLTITKCIKWSRSSCKLSMTVTSLTWLAITLTRIVKYLPLVALVTQPRCSVCEVHALASTVVWSQSQLLHKVDRSEEHSNPFNTS